MPSPRAGVEVGGRGQGLALKTSVFGDKVENSSLWEIRI